MNKEYRRGNGNDRRQKEQVNMAPCQMEHLKIKHRDDATEQMAGTVKDVDYLFQERILHQC